MKKYKTWEVVKMLTENPKLKFKNTVEVDDINLIGVDGLEIFWFTDDGVRASRFTPKLNELDWTLIQQPIPFMEAAKAYSEGKTIRCERKDIKEDSIYEFKGISNSPMTDETGNPVSCVEILEGRWYVEDSNE